MYVTVNGVHLFFDVLNPKLAIEGERFREKPVLVCLHGGPGGDHQSLRPLFDGLSDVAQVLYIDQRGGGRSEHGPSSGWTLDQWGDDVAALCDALGVENPIVLGVSGGAMTAQAYLSRHPGRAAGAILLNACSRLDRDVIVDGFEKLGGAVAAAAARAMYTRSAPEDVPAFFQHCLPHYSRRPLAGPPPGGARTSFNFAVSQHFFSEGGEAFRFDFRDRLGAVTCPVLAISGAHDPVTRAEWAREVVEALPAGNGDYLEFAEASHMIAGDVPELLFAAVRRFIAGIASD